MPALVRSADVERHDRTAAAFMVVHLLVQVGSGIVGVALMLGFGGLMGVIGAAERELEAMAMGGIFGGIGLLAGLFLLAQAVPAAAAAWGLWRGSSWRMPAALIASLLAFSHFPLGTGLALGTLFFAYKSYEAERAEAV